MTLCKIIRISKNQLPLITNMSPLCLIPNASENLRFSNCAQTEPPSPQSESNHVKYSSWLCITCTVNIYNLRPSYFSAAIRQLNHIQQKASKSFNKIAFSCHVTRVHLNVILFLNTKHIGSYPIQWCLSFTYQKTNKHI